MSKTAWFLVILFAAIGVAIGLHYGASVISTAKSFIQNPAQILEWIKRLPQTAWIAIASGVAGVGAAIVGLAKNVNQYKQQINQKATQDVNVLKQDVTKLQTEKTTLQNQLDQTTKTYSEKFATLSDNYVELHDHTMDLEAANKQLIDERNYYYNELKKLEAKSKEPVRVP